jgi:DNA replication protein DnaC
MIKNLSAEDMAELEEIKKKLLSSCKLCEGKGRLWKNDEVVDCECFTLFSYIIALKWSRIPEDYWGLNIKNLSVKSFYKKQAQKYIDRIDRALERGLGFLFSGTQKGIGKTSLMCCIGKEAVMKGYEVFFVLAQNIIDDKFTSNQEILERVRRCDLLLIDELDKLVMRTESNVPKQLENLLRSILPNRKSVIIATNFREKEIEERFSITSLLKRYLKFVSMKGDDYASTLEEKWDEELEQEEFDYENAVLKKESKIYAGVYNGK